jgi:hypothetical protein
MSPTSDGFLETPFPIYAKPIEMANIKGNLLCKGRKLQALASAHKNNRQDS